MKAVTTAFPDDLDARTLYAEALMDLRPWNYWSRDGVPFDETIEVERALTQVLAKHRNHPGALHLWIHLWEPTDTPERAEAEADRLLPLMPGAGHIVHMPAHIYQRVGRHADVISSNILAAKADEDYITQCKAQGMYPLGYYPHNLHFIWMGASASGQGKLAIDSAHRVARSIPDEALGSLPILQGFMVVPYWAMVRFGRWSDILADAGPRHDTVFTRAAWRYARALALTATNRLDEADAELALLRTLVNDPQLKGQVTFSSNSGYAIMRIAPEVVAGELAAKRKDWDRALLHLERAVRYEDGLDLPGAVRLARAREAEPRRGADRGRPARRGRSGVLGRPEEEPRERLVALRRGAGLRAQGRTDDAAIVEARFKKAWKDADTPLSAARIADDVSVVATRHP